MSQQSDDELILLLVLFVAALLGLNQCSATVTPTQYNNAVTACKDSDGLAYYRSHRTGRGSIAHDIVCKDGRSIEEWPPGHPRPDKDRVRIERIQ